MPAFLYGLHRHIHPQHAECGKRVSPPYVVSAKNTIEGDFDGKYGKCNGMVSIDVGVGGICAEMVAFHTEYMCHYPLCG